MSCGHGRRVFVSVGPRHADGGRSDEGTRERGSCVHRGAAKRVGVGGNASDGGQNVSGHVNEGRGHVLREYGHLHRRRHRRAVGLCVLICIERDWRVGKDAAALTRAQRGGLGAWMKAETCEDSVGHIGMRW